MNEVWRAGPEEWQAYRDVRLAALADDPDAFASTLDQELVLAEQDWRDRLTTAAIFLGKRDGKLVATAAGLPLPNNEAEMVGVWVHPNARGTGLAAEIIKAVIDWGKDRAKMTVHLAEGNAAAERLYTKLGFEPTGHREPLARRPSITEIQLELTRHCGVGPLPAQ